MCADSSLVMLNFFFFMYLLAIFMFSFEKTFIQVLCPFFNQVGVYLPLHITCIFCMLTPYQKWLRNIFSHCIGLSLHSVDFFSLHWRSFLVRYNSICLFLLLLLMLLGSSIKNHSPDQCQEAFFLCFLLEVL